jgi:hypothetical protein
MVAPLCSNSLCVGELGENRIDIPAAVENANDFDGILAYSMENNVGMNRNRPQAWQQLVPLSPGVRPIFERRAGLLDVAQLIVRNRSEASCAK